MTDLGALKELLERHANRPLIKGWTKLIPTVDHNDLKNRITIVIEDLGVTFVFSESEELIGAFNWQE
ncbi:hypothetical protein LCGC14_1940300 [marine sediment metagenome]|uniref:Uncharacterized protein n=1 Tax=marine sediment metagenome TaxID=412755 RepID=A0A0F9HYY2_9ZZZZ